MDASIILCTCNRAGMLPRVLDDLLALDAPEGCRWEIVVVDNNSRDETAQLVEEYRKRHPRRIRYLFEPMQGKSFALNRGVRESEGEILLFTDDDVRVEAGWMRAVLEAFERNPECMGIGGRLLPILPPDVPSELDEEEIRTFHSFDFGEQPRVLQNNPRGDNMAYRREAFVRHGLFRTDLGPTAGDRAGLSEDSEFSQRIMEAGESVCYVPRAVVHHHVRPERLKLKYLDRWHYQYGRALWRREKHPEKTRLLLSTPQYLLRQLAQQCLAWSLTFSRRERRHRWWKVQVLRGKIHEARNGGLHPQPEEVESYEDSRHRS